MYIQVTKTIKEISSKTKFEDERRNNGITKRHCKGL